MALALSIQELQRGRGGQQLAKSPHGKRVDCAAEPVCIAAQPTRDACV